MQKEHYVLAVMLISAAIMPMVSAANYGKDLSTLAYFSLNSTDGNTTQTLDSVSSKKLSVNGSLAVLSPSGYQMNRSTSHFLNGTSLPIGVNATWSGFMQFNSTYPGTITMAMLGQAGSSGNRTLIGFGPSNTRIGAAVYNGTDFQGDSIAYSQNSTCHTLVMRYNGTNRTMGIIMDGNPGTGSGDIFNYSSGTAVLNVGKTNGGIQPFNGTIQRFGFSNTYWSDANVTSLLTDGCPLGAALSSGSATEANITVNYNTSIKNVLFSMIGWKDTAYSISNQSYIDLDGDGAINSGGDVVRNYTYARTITSGALGTRGSVIIADANFEWFRYTNATVSTTRTDINPRNAGGVQNAVAWADTQNISFLFTNAFMTQWLANNDSTCGDNGIDVGRSADCSPNSYDNWTIMADSFFKEVGCDTTLNCYIEEPTNEGYNPGSVNFFHADGTCADRVAYAISDIGNYTSRIRTNLSYIQGIYFTSGSFNAGGTACANNWTRSVLNYLNTSGLVNISTDFISIHESGDNTTFINRIANASAIVQSYLPGARMVITEGEVYDSTIDGTTTSNGDDTLHFNLLMSIYAVMYQDPYLHGIYWYSSTLDTNLSVAISNNDVDYNYVCWHDPQLSNDESACLWAVRNASTNHPVGSTVKNWTSTTSSIRAIFTNSTVNSSRLTLISRESSTVFNVTVKLNTSLQLINATDANGTSYSISSNNVTVGNLSAYGVRTIILTFNQSGAAAADTTNPVLTVTAPTNTSYSTNNVTVTFNATDDVAVSALWFNNGTVNTTYTTSTSVNVSEGPHTFTFYANDTSGNNATPVQRNFTTDTTAPTFTITSPTATNYTSNNISVNFTSTDSGAGVSARWFSNGTVNTTYTGATYVTVNQGSNTYTFYSNDTLNNTGSTTVSFYVDSVNPSVNITTATTQFGILNVTMTFTVTDANASSCRYNVTSSGGTEVSSTSLSCSANNVSFLVTSKTSYTFNLYANDTLGNNVSRNFNFSVVDNAIYAYPQSTCSVGTDCIFLVRVEGTTSCAYNAVNYTVRGPNSENLLDATELTLFQAYTDACTYVAPLFTTQTTGTHTISVSYTDSRSILFDTYSLTLDIGGHSGDSSGGGGGGGAPPTSTEDGQCSTLAIGCELPPQTTEEPSGFTKEQYMIPVLIVLFFVMLAIAFIAYEP